MKFQITWGGGSGHSGEKRIENPRLWYADLVGVGKALGDFAQGQVEHKSGGSIDDLEQAISNNKIVVVAVAWQTTWEILSDIPHATVGHYMVAVGFDQPGGQLIFLNPGLQPNEGSTHLYPMTFQEFDTILEWNKQPVCPGRFHVDGFPLEYLSENCGSTTF